MAMDEEEPTPGAGPCLEEWNIVEEETARVLHGILEPTEFNYADLLVPHEKYEVFIRVFIGLDCLHPVELRVRGCGRQAAEVRRLFEEPEFTRIMLEGDCIEVAAPFDIPVRIERSLDMLDLKPPLDIAAYRMVKWLVRDW